MHKWSIPGALIALMAIAYVGYSTLPSLKTGPVEPAQENLIAVNSSDYLTIATLVGLTEKAPVVAIGTIEGVAGSRNLARDPHNPQNPDPRLEIAGIDYRFKVDRFLKGSAPASILVTEAKSRTWKGEKPVLYEGFKAMPPGGRYILFLRETRDGSGRWIGVAEPWRFAIHGAKVSVESKWGEAQKHFTVMDVNEFAAHVEAHLGER